MVRTLVEKPVGTELVQPKPDDENDPLNDGGDDEDPKYTVHLKVPLVFMERLETIAKRVNKKRRREGKKKRALGWFVVTHLEDWMAQAEARIAQEDGD